MLSSQSPKQGEQLVRILIEVSKAPGGKEAIGEMNQAVSVLIPVAKNTEARNAMMALQDITLKLGK